MPTPVGPVPPDPDDPDLWDEWYDTDDAELPPQRHWPRWIQLTAIALLLGFALVYAVRFL